MRAQLQLPTTGECSAWRSSRRCHWASSCFAGDVPVGGGVGVVSQPPIPLGVELLLPMMCPLGAVVFVSQPPLPSGLVVVVFWAKACPLTRSAARAIAIDLII